MKTIAVYESFDHKIFKSEEDCQRYEENVLQPRKNIFNSITFFDREGSLIQQPSVEDEDYIKKFCEITMSTWEFVILRELSQEEQDFFYDECGFDIPRKAGHYIWSVKKDNWLSFEEDIKSFLNRWHLKDIGQIKAQMIYSN